MSTHPVNYQAIHSLLDSVRDLSQYNLQTIHQTKANIVALRIIAAISIAASIVLVGLAANSIISPAAGCLAIPLAWLGGYCVGLANKLEHESIQTSLNTLREIAAVARLHH